MHNLEQTADNQTSFAYNTNQGTPWHGLGVQIDGDSTIDEILEASRGDYEVSKHPVTVPDPDNPGILLETDKWFTMRQRPATVTETGVTPGGNQVLGIVGNRYETIQNRAALEFALSLTNTDNDRIIDCAGVLADGKKFFATITLPDLVVDPDGFADRHTRRLVVVTGHDGRTSLQAVNTVVRAVCSNTVDWALEDKARTVSIRHTRSNRDTVVETKKVLGLALTADEKFQRIALDMAGGAATFNVVEKVADRLWGQPTEEWSDFKIDRRNERLEKLAVIWNSDLGAGSVGRNRWAAFNTLSHYIEHEQSTRLDRNARALSNGFGNHIRRLATLVESV